MAGFLQASPGRGMPGAQPMPADQAWYFVVVFPPSLPLWYGSLARPQGVSLAQGTRGPGTTDQAMTPKAASSQLHDLGLCCVRSQLFRFQSKSLLICLGRQ